MKIVAGCNLVLLSFLLAASAAKAASCDQVSGAREFDRGNLDVAFKRLKECEDKREVSGETLANLAVLYGSLDYDDLTEEDSLQKVWGLLHRAAAGGHEEALASLIRLYANGQPEILVRPNAKKQRCLERIERAAQYKNRRAIEACLSK